MRCPRCHRRVAEGKPCSRDDITVTQQAPRAPVEPPDVPGVTLLAPLGAGGFGVVWDARDAAGEPVAVKVGHGSGELTRARHRREAEALRRVGPPHVPALHVDGVLEDGRPYLVMERLEGRTLAAIIEEHAEPPPLETVHALAAALLESLAAVHARGLIHRDLKPENVFVREGGAAAIMDFGLARVPDAPGLTRTGAVLGTAEYLAPEQLRGEEPDTRADLYAFGVVLYELLTLRPPFVGDRATVEHGQLTLRPLRPGVLRPLPPALEQLVLACLAKEAARRPATVAAVRAGLEAAKDRAANPPAEPPPRALPEGPQPVVLLFVETQGSSTTVSASVRRRGGWLARQRGSRYLAAFAGAAGGDPRASALAAGHEIVDAEGGRAALQVAAVTVRVRASGAPAFGGEAVERPESWLPDGEWGGVVAGADVAPLAAPPLVGRDELVETMAAAAARAVAERVPALFTLVGERGLGKSRLLDEAAARLPAGVELVRVRGGDPPADLVPRAPADPQELRLALGQTLRERASARPLAVLVDDAHRAGDVLLDALEYATWGGSGVALWVAVAALPALDELRPSWGERAERRERVTLGPLDPTSASELAAHLLLPAEYPPAQTLRQLVAWTGGNPLYLAESVRALKRAGLVRKRASSEGWHLATELVEALPSSPLLDWLAVQKLAELPAPIAACARVAAVLGATIERDELEHLVDTAERAGDLAGAADPGVALAELVVAGVLRRDGERWSWSSPLLRDAVYGRLEAGERARLHRHALALCGDRLEARARHASASGAHDEAAAAHLALGEQALAGHRALDADAHFTRALEHAREGPRRLAALAGRGRVRYRLDRVPEAVEDLAAARVLAAGAPAPLQADLLLEEATARDWMETFDRSRELVLLARPLVEAADDARLLARQRVAEGRSAWRTGSAAEARVLLEEGAALASAAGDAESRVIALLLLAPIRMMAGEPAAAAAALDEVLARCQASGDRLHLWAAYLNRCFLTLTDASAGAGLGDLRRCVEIAREDGHPRNERMASFNLAELMFWTGDELEALALARRARLLEERFAGGILPHTPLLLARIHTARGDTAAADHELDWLRAHAGDDGWRPSDRLLHRALETLRDGAAGAWDALVDEARAALPPEEQLEILYWRMVVASPAERATVRSLAEPLLGERPFWRRRFEARDSADTHS